MSGLAWAAHRLEASVTGSDRTDSTYGAVAGSRIPVTVGHDPPPTSRMAPKSWSRRRSPTRIRSWPSPVRNDLAVRHRSELLAEICSSRRQIAVAGTHGRRRRPECSPTPCANWGRTLRFHRRRIARIPGRKVPQPTAAGARANGWWSKPMNPTAASHLDPEIAVITNIEMDHHARWENLTSFGSAGPRLRRKASRGGAAGGRPRDGGRAGLRRSPDHP